MQRTGFLTVDDYYFDRNPMPLSRIDNAPDPQCLSVKEWAKAFLAGKQPEGLAPLEVAENLDRYAATAQTALPALRNGAGDNSELKETLNDIESMAYLGRYYADKIRGAAKLALYREGGREDKKSHQQAVAHLKDASEEWKAYAGVLSSGYKTSLLARTHFLDWNATLKEVEKEVVTVQQEADYPKIRFANLTDGARLPAESELQVEVEVTDGIGVPEVALYLNGLTLKADATKPLVWNGDSDELLKALKDGMYHLETVAEDANGFRSRRKIQIVVGDGSKRDATNWRDQIHQVILNEGELFEDGDIFDFPRLECFLTLEEDGRLALFGGAPSDRDGLIWKTRGKADRPTPQPVPFRFYAALKNGKLTVYRGTSGNPDAMLWESKTQSEQGPYQLGITAAKKFIIYRDVEGKRKIVWRSQ